MSNNIPKKLQIKAELIRRLDTASDMMRRGERSSAVKVVTLHIELGRHAAGAEVDLQFWDDFLAGKEMN